ncbi:MAG: iron-sulfur cluster-binding protein [Propionibacteriaceae bacterium]|nr:iron-sulfur cluster-binding protein [Propionibacteriaceae bacterium]
MPVFKVNARRELGNVVMRKNLRFATHTIRQKRYTRIDEVGESRWQQLRTAAEQIKNRVGRHLDTYLEDVEKKFTEKGVTVHWARDAAEANQIIVSLVKAKGVHEVVKIKSMVTQEIDMNEALEAADIAAWETDLAEIIVQLGHDRPSHILVPAIHRNREEVREIFLKEMKLYGKPAPEDLSNDPPALADASRQHLREKFLRAEVGISGGNFIVAETGSLVIVESEGNGRMCLTLPKTLISVVGIEKIVPTFQDLEVFLQLLPRSSTAERMNPYTSLWSGITEGDGPQEMHLVLVDNGRTKVLADPLGREALRCIRCSACLNICPVYERVSGHAYGSVYPGPIGIALTPQLRGIDHPIDKSLPFACSLCFACADACPVKIPLPDIIVAQRHRVAEKKQASKRPHIETTAVAAMNWFWKDAKHWELALKAGSLGGKAMDAIKMRKIGPLPYPMSTWTNARDVPAPPTQSFRDWWRQERGEQ